MHFLAQNHVVWRIECENRSNGLVYMGTDETKKEVNIRRLWLYISHMWGLKPLDRLNPSFLEEDIRDVITCFKFGDDHFRGLADSVG